MSDLRRMYAAGGSGRWDERRNTSAVHPVDPHALHDCLVALARFRQDQPELAAWIEDGHPTMTDDEHAVRFGAAYEGGRRRRQRSLGAVAAPVAAGGADVAADRAAPPARAHSPVAVHGEDAAAEPGSPFKPPARLRPDGVQHRPADCTPPPDLQLGLTLA